MIRCTKPEQEFVRAEFLRLHTAEPDAHFGDLITRAQLVLPVDRRQDFSKKSPSQITWLGVTARQFKRRNSSAVVGAASPPRPARPDSTPTALTLDDAIAVLCDVLLARIEDQLEGKLETILAQRIATSAIKLAPKPAKPVDLDKLNTLDDATLKLEIIKAQASGDRIRLLKLIAVRRKREEAANTIEFQSGEAR